MKQGGYGEAYKAIHVLPTAKPDMATDVKLFADRRDLKQIYFWISSSEIIAHSLITLKPHASDITAVFGNVRGRLLSFPAHYLEYLILVTNEVPVTDAELNYVLEWNSAERLFISNQSDLAFRLSKRGEALKGMANLEDIYSSVDQSIYRRFKVEPFFEHMPSLTTAHFDRKGLTDAQWLHFIENQELEPYELDANYVVYFRSNCPTKGKYEKDEL